MPKGCDSVMRAQLGKRYAEKKAYAVLLRNGYTDIWALREWHSVCLTFNISNNLLVVYLDGSVKTAVSYVKENFKSGNIMLFQEIISRHPRENSIYQVETEITDLNIWNTSISTSMIKSWSNCESELHGNFLNWSSLPIDENIPSYSLDLTEICSPPKHFIVHPDLMNLADTEKFCTKMGGVIAVAENNQTLKQMKESFIDKDGLWLEDCQDGFFIGYTDEKEEGSWVSISDGTSITVGHNWASGYPTNNPTFNQAVYTKGKLFDRWEQNSYCPICSLPEQRLFELDNICAEDHHIDRFYIMVNTSYFVGLLATRLYKNSSELETTWVIETTDDKSQIATLSVPPGQDSEEFIPTGLYSWSYSEGVCNTELSEFKTPNGLSMMLRPMNFHLSVERPGNFCCSDGTCISSELVCDGNQDCSDDELDYYNRIEKTQMRDTEASQDPDVLVNVSIMDLLEVSQEKSTVSVFFWIKLEWKNSQLAFKFLHENYLLNNVDIMTQHSSSSSSIWIPKLRYYHIYDGQITTLKTTNYIEKGLSQNFSLSSSPLRPTELYEGSQNTFMMDILHRDIFLKRLFLYFFI